MRIHDHCKCILKYLDGIATSAQRRDEMRSQIRGWVPPDRNMQWTLIQDQVQVSVTGQMQLKIPSPRA